MLAFSYSCANLNLLVILALVILAFMLMLALASWLIWTVMMSQVILVKAFLILC